MVDCLSPEGYGSDIRLHVRVKRQNELSGTSNQFWCIMSKMTLQFHIHHLLSMGLTSKDHRRLKVVKKHRRDQFWAKKCNFQYNC